MIHRSELLRSLNASQYLQQGGFAIEIGRYNEILIETRSDPLPSRFIFYAWHRFSREQLMRRISLVQGARAGAHVDQRPPRFDGIESASKQLASTRAGDLHACVFAAYFGRGVDASGLSDHVQDLVVFGERPDGLSFGFRTIAESGTEVAGLFRHGGGFYESYYAYGTSALDELAFHSTSTEGPR